MKKSEFIQILGQLQPEDTRVLGFLLFKGQDSEAIRQLKSILKNRQVFSLSDEAQLPSEAIEAVKKTIRETTNVDSRTKIVLDSLRQLLTKAANSIAESSSSTGAEGSSNSNVVTVMSAASTTCTPDSFKLGPGFFNGMATLVAYNIFSWLDDKSLRAYFRVFVTNNDVEYEPVRQAALNSIQERFLQFVADAEMKSAEAILKLAMVKKTILMKLLTTNKTVIQKNGIPVTGTALEIALKCWDWSSCEGGQEEMTEMLMRYLRELPEGEQLIQTTFTNLFPNGYEAHQEDQANRAEEFSESILEPLAKTLFDASDEDIALVYAITDVGDNEVDDYINKYLSENKLWQALMLHHEAIKEFMIKDSVYKPCYLTKAFEIVGRKYEEENWGNFSKGDDRLALLTIHGVGGVQACSPTIVGMLFARGGIWGFYNLDESKRNQFKVDRNCAFKYGNGEVFARSVGGVWLVSKKFWAVGVVSEGVSQCGRLVGCCCCFGGGTSVSRLGFICQTKTQHLEASLRAYCSSTNNESMCNAITPR